MYKSVLSNRNIKLCNVEKNYLTNTIDLANKIEANHKYGISTKPDLVKYIKIKHLFNIVTSLDSDYNCCLQITNKQDILNSLNKIVNSNINIEPIWNYSTVNACVIPMDLSVNQ